MAEAPQRWSVRARRTGPKAVSVYARHHVFAAGAATSPGSDDAYPSGLELLLGALAGELLRGLEAQATRRRLTLHEAEARLSAQLHRPLVHLGVVGEEGDPGLSKVEGTVFASADGAPEALEEAWAETLARSVFVQTLKKAAEVKLKLSPAP